LKLGGADETAVHFAIGVVASGEHRVPEQTSLLQYADGKMVG
jgi:hypothetical protein